MTEIYQNEDGVQVQLLSREEANLISNFTDTKADA